MAGSTPAHVIDSDGGCFVLRFSIPSVLHTASPPGRAAVAIA